MEDYAEKDEDLDKTNVNLSIKDDQSDPGQGMDQAQD